MKRILLLGDSIRMGYDKYVKSAFKDTENYNKAACEIAKKHGGHTNDLYSLMSDCPNSYHSDMTHYYTKEGTEIITNAVVNSIAEYLNVKASKLDYDKCYNQVDKFLGM